MRQELEIEFKNLLSEQEYLSLFTHYASTKQPIWQANDYFDTPDFELRKKGAALRIREKKQGLVLTLKQPHEEGLLETHVTLSENDAEDLFKYGLIHSDEMNHQLKSFNLQGSLEHLGRLETERIETVLPEGLLVLDKSRYLGHTDYELEFEVSNFEQGQKDFEQLLSEHDIPQRETKNKIVRFMERKALS
ncbi:CYTH domain-containing protein [Exiguobacterium acetylicum]|nr:CYTH domain-containing protein [Exiguobacterium acetylicum]UKS57701.1 CYTH domain-containing protein [Exiguobacterium acetylicum]